MRNAPLNAFVPAIALFAASCALCSCGIFGDISGAVHYVDPENGSMDNDGSPGRPWSSIQEVIDGLTETCFYGELPAGAGRPASVRNPGGPVRGGDTIVLRAGYYGELDIFDAYNIREIRVRAEPGATAEFSRVHFRAAGGWRLSGLTVNGSSGGATSDADTLVSIESHDWRGPCSDITVEDCRIFTVPDDRAWTDAAGWDAEAASAVWVNGDDISILRNTCENVNFGIQVVGDRCLVRGNAVDFFCGDALRGLGDDNVFEGNLVKNALNVNENHADGFQSWAVDGDPSERVVLRGNVILQWDGAVRPALSRYLQGIGLFDGPYVGWTIENNVIVTDMYHGISLYGGADCVIANNTVIDETAGNGIAPWIAVLNHKDGTPSSGCLVRNNASPAFIIEGRGTRSDFNRIVKTEEYESLFASPGGFDFRLRPGSALIDAGTDESAPAEDILGAKRPRGLRCDIGAYESF